MTGAQWAICIIVAAFGVAPLVAAALVRSGDLREANGDREEDDLDREHQAAADATEDALCRTNGDDAK